MKKGERTQKKLAADAPEVEARVKAALDLVRISALKLRRQIGPSVDVDQLKSMGHEGLLLAARTFDADYGSPFRAWAYLKIRTAMIDGLRREAELPRQAYANLRAYEAANEARKGQIEDESAAAGETAESADARIAATASSLAIAMAASFLTARRDIHDTIPDPQESPETLTLRKRLLDQVREAIDRLQDDERALLVKCYFEDSPLDEAARSIGLSKSWGSRLHARALEKVAKDLKKRKIENDE